MRKGYKLFMIITFVVIIVLTMTTCKGEFDGIVTLKVINNYNNPILRVRVVDYRTEIVFFDRDNLGITTSESFSFSIQDLTTSKNAIVTSTYVVIYLYANGLSDGYTLKDSIELLSNDTITTVILQANGTIY